MTKPKRIAIDFEFRDHKQATMSLVAVSAQVEGEEPMSWWLYQDEVAQADFKLWVRHYQERYPDAIWLAYGATAEAECFLTLGIDPREFRWHDLHTDFIQAQNGSPTYCHGVFWAQRRIKVKTCCDEERCDCTDKQMKSVGKATWQKQFSVPVIVNTKREWEDERGAGTYVDWVSESRWQSVRFPTRTVVFDRNASFDERKKQENKAFEACAAHIKNLGLSSEEIKPNLLNASLRLCGIERDPQAKDHARDVILGKRVYTAEDTRLIMEYAADDTSDLFAMDDKLQRILEAQSKQGTEWVLAARAWRGRAAANHAHLVRRGLRLHKTRLENLRRNKQKVFEKAYLRWNATVQPMFTWKNKERRWGSSTSAKNAFLKRICAENGIDDWERTARNDYSTSTKAGDALDRYADLVHQWRGAECEYDADGPLKGFQRFGKMQSSLNSIPELERDHGAEAEVGNDGYDDDVTMLSFLGDDLHLRPYFGLYGTQTGRNAPKATGFLPAKAAWLRALIDPEPGYAYVELDYSSQETFIAGAISGDAGILRAYDKNGPTKGDPYLAFAIDAELITQAQYDDYKNDGPDAKHVKYIRKLCKVIVLGSQFGMGAKKLAIALRSATRDMSLTDEYAKELLALHARAYATYYKWKEQQAHLYFDRKLPMILPCGWYLAAGRRERDKLSVLNFPVQGRGSSIMRLALDKLLDAGIEVVAPVHDAFIFRAKIDELDRICEIAKRCMIEAADEVLGLKGMRVGDPEIVRHGEIAITEKGERDYETYKWAFEEPTERTIDVPMGDPLDEEF